VRDRLAEPVAERDLRLPVAEPSETSASPSPSPSETLRLAVAEHHQRFPLASTSTPPASESAGGLRRDLRHDHGRRRRPASWNDLTVTFTPSTGTARRFHRSGRQGDQPSTPGLAGLSVTATAEGYPDSTSTIKYKAPSDCDGGGLPVTGAAAGGIAAGASRCSRSAASCSSWPDDAR